MNSEILLRIDGHVERIVELTYADLADIPADQQIQDVSRIDPKRKGDAVTLVGLLNLARPKVAAVYLGLHSATDDFHASIPLAPVRDSAFLIYRLDGKPLAVNAGGPVRFYIPDHAACHTDEIDECANVKFVDHIELTVEKGFDNRPDDEQEHAKLHAEPSET